MYVLAFLFSYPLDITRRHEGVTDFEPMVDHQVFFFEYSCTSDELRIPYSICEKKPSLSPAVQPMGFVGIAIYRFILRRLSY